MFLIASKNMKFEDDFNCKTFKQTNLGKLRDIVDCVVWLRSHGLKWNWDPKLSSAQAPNILGSALYLANFY